MLLIYVGCVCVCVCVLGCVCVCVCVYAVASSYLCAECKMKLVHLVYLLYRDHRRALPYKITVILTSRIWYMRVNKNPLMENLINLNESNTPILLIRVYKVGDV